MRSSSDILSSLLDVSDAANTFEKAALRAGEPAIEAPVLVANPHERLLPPAAPAPRRWSAERLFVWALLALLLLAM